MLVYILILLICSAIGFLIGGANGLAVGVIIGCLLCAFLAGSEV